MSRPRPLPPSRRRAALRAALTTRYPISCPITASDTLVQVLGDLLLAGHSERECAARAHCACCTPFDRAVAMARRSALSISGVLIAGQPRGLA